MTRRSLDSPAPRVASFPGSVEQANYLRVHMAALRCKIAPDPTHPQSLLTEAGVGYRLWEPES